MNIQEFSIGIIGCGRWGVNHVKIANSLLGGCQVTVFDANPQAAIKVAEISGDIKFTSDKNEIIKDNKLLGVIIATPAETHFAFAKECLENGKHVLVEKPITLHSNEAKDLVAIAKKNDRKLMVGHVLLYHPAILKLKELYKLEKIGALQYIYSIRLKIGAICSDENILWSFAPNYISIIQYLTESNPIEIACNGANFVQNGIEDTTITYLKYPKNIHAHIFVSWLHPFKEQRLVVIGDKGMMVFEDSLAKDKLKFYPKGFQTTAQGIQKFEGDFESVQFGEAQPLAEEHKHFYDCIINNKQPLTDGTHALEVLEILEQASERLKL